MEWTDRRVQRAFQYYLRIDEEEALAFAESMDAENFQIVALERLIDQLEEADDEEDIDNLEEELDSYEEQLENLTE